LGRNVFKGKEDKYQYGITMRALFQFQGVWEQVLVLLGEQEDLFAIQENT